MISSSFCAGDRRLPEEEGAGGSGAAAPWLVAAAAGFLLAGASLAVCVCCRKPKGFSEFRSATVLTEITSQVGHHHPFLLGFGFTGVGRRD